MLLAIVVGQAAMEPGWVGPTVALSLVVVALSFVGIAVGVIVVASRLSSRCSS